MIVGQAALHDSSYSARLVNLLDAMQALGCKVWLEGMSMRFDCLEMQDGVAYEDIVNLMQEYVDVVTWLPDTYLTDVMAALPSKALQPPAAAFRQAPTPQRRWIPFSGKRPEHKRGGHVN